jgi:hypothetical protein
MHRAPRCISGHGASVLGALVGQFAALGSGRGRGSGSLAPPAVTRPHALSATGAASGASRAILRSTERASRRLIAASIRHWRKTACDSMIAASFDG